MVYALLDLQLFPDNVYTEVELSHRTVAGVDPWDFSEGSNGIEFTVSWGYPVKFEKEVYKCPNGDTIGLNLLSEPYVLNSQSIGEYDFIASKQKIGVKLGLLRPQPIYFCSPAFRKMIEEEKLSGFEFEITVVRQNRKQVVNSSETLDFTGSCCWL